MYKNKLNRYAKKLSQCPQAVGESMRQLKISPKLFSISVRAIAFYLVLGLFDRISVTNIDNTSFSLLFLVFTFFLTEYIIYLHYIST